jgi:hypothetical protein
MSKISYSAVVLDNKSHDLLKNEFIRQIPDNWDYIGHHMTIKMGELDETRKSRIGELVELLVTHIGKDDRVMAVRVNDNNLSDNAIPHITLAVNRKGGGKPFHSNKIADENWKPVANRFKITGTIQEIPHK